MKNIVICADLKEESLNRIKSLHDDIDLKHSKVHLIHVFEIQYYVSEFTPYVYPTEDQYSEMESSAVSILSKLGADLGISKENLEVKCFFAKSREEKITEYLESSKANMVVSATRGRHGVDGFFSSSLTDYLCKYSPCDVLVLRPKK
jgi:nucleotide-binding universal stress UspA family protein